MQESIAGYGTLIAELKTRVQYMGGEWVGEYCSEVDIVVTDTVGPTATDHKAGGKPVLLTAWVEETWRLLLDDKLGDITGTYKSNGLQVRFISSLFANVCSDPVALSACAVAACWGTPFFVGDAYRK